MSSESRMEMKEIMDLLDSIGIDRADVPVEEKVDRLATMLERIVSDINKRMPPDDGTISPEYCGVLSLIVAMLNNRGNAESDPAKQWADLVVARIAFYCVQWINHIAPAMETLVMEKKDLEERVANLEKMIQLS